MTDTPQPSIEIKFLSAWYRHNQVLDNVSLTIPEKEIVSVIGPSGCGKSTLIRCLNRMHELNPEAASQGEIIFEGKNILNAETDPVGLRRKIGMLFQQPNPFPGLSIRENVLAGLKFIAEFDASTEDQVIHESLSRVGLWDEVADRLSAPATELALGQQQRLCLARALAVGPKVLLMDEPCASLDPISTARIEGLLQSLKESVTILFVTHNLQQAARVSDRCAFLVAGKLIEYSDTDTMFTAPQDMRTENYLTGKFG
jgi:phosphate transport system ATP-binding protein